MKTIPLLRTIIALALLALWPVLMARAAVTYREPFRPQFHFTPATNWMNDPNGLVFYDGEYHLFYQYNPFGNKWGHMSWGHAVSRDLVRWEHLPIALREENDVMIFSGSAVVDWKNTSGFGRDGKPPMVAIYTGHYTKKPLQNQHLAYSNDKGRTWTKFAGNPVLDIGAQDFRDPKVMWHESKKRWVMTVAWPIERKVRFYSSPDLKTWTHLSDFGPAGSTAGIWECPDLFPLRIEGKRGLEKWVLIVNVGSGAPASGSGCQYFVGGFDGNQFTLDAPFPKPQPEFVPEGKIVDQILPANSPARGATQPALWADFGPDFYAAVSWGDILQRDGRRLWLGWMSNWQYANDVPTSPWRSAMSLPRELSLRQTPSGLRLIQTPAGELKKLRGPRQSFKAARSEEANAWLKKLSVRGAALELACEFPAATAGLQGIRFFNGTAEEILLGVNRDQGVVFVDRTHSGNVTFHPGFAGRHSAPLAARGGPVKLHVFVDACSLELFVNDGELAMTSLILPSEKQWEVELLSSGSKRVQLEIWPLRSIWESTAPK